MGPPDGLAEEELLGEELVSPDGLARKELGPQNGLAEGVSLGEELGPPVER
jgi:hypothetical protein